MNIATLRYTRNLDGFFETVETSRHGVTEFQALDFIYSLLNRMVETGEITLENIVFIKTQEFKGFDECQ